MFGPYVSVWCQRLTIWFVPDDLCFAEHTVTVTSRFGVVKVEFGTLFFNPCFGNLLFQMVVIALSLNAKPRV